MHACNARWPSGRGCFGGSHFCARHAGHSGRHECHCDAWISPSAGTARPEEGEPDTSSQGGSSFTATPAATGTVDEETSGEEVS